MQKQQKWSLLRRLLRALGLRPEAVDELTDQIAEMVGDKESGKGQTVPEFPYVLRDDFLSRGEHNFYLVLRSIVGDRAVICPKIGLGEIVFTSIRDPKLYRTYTNKIDRKHVDFLLCDPTTMKPLFGIELDDRSHEREDRKQRDRFVGQVFKAAKLPLVRIPARRQYATTEIAPLVQAHLPQLTAQVTAPRSTSIPEPPKPLIQPIKPLTPQPVAVASPAEEPTAPTCPKCGGEMKLRTAKSGSNQGNKFWGCSNYPRCKAILDYTVAM